jgi:DtxR family Mn-dependent transcriptional regulator
LERDGLLHVEGDRHIELTESGRSLATRVMRKHRLAECLLVNVIGMPWEEVHIEACRWEHVMSEEVERRLVTLLENPTLCPHGNPIPGLAELGVEWNEGLAAGPPAEALVTMMDVATPAGVPVIVRRISEQVQSDSALMLKLKQIGIQPGHEVTLAAGDDGVRVTGDDTGGAGSDLPRDIAAHVFVVKR